MIVLAIVAGVLLAAAIIITPFALYAHATGENHAERADDWEARS